MTNPFAYEFMRNAYAACAIVAAVSGVVGYFLVLRGETFAGHALSHVGFPGATGAVLIGVSPFIGLTVFTVAAGIGIGLLGERAQRDVAIGLVLTLSLGLGLLFLHFYTSYASLATNILFGNVLGISQAMVGALFVLGVLSLAGLALIARPLLFSSLQPELAEAKGVSQALVSAFFMTIVAVTTAEAVQIVGVLLVFALMVAPAACASRLTRTIAGGVAMSAVAALIIAWSGLTLAFVTDWPTSFWITALGALIYLGSTAYASQRNGQRTAVTTLSRQRPDQRGDRSAASH